MPKVRLRLLGALAVALSTVCGSLAQTPALPPPPPVSPEAIQERFFHLFVPARTEAAALSPDGKHLAYTQREKDALFVVVIDIDNPGKALAKVPLITDKQATPLSSLKTNEQTPASVRWMQWVTPTRLVVETNLAFSNHVKIGEESQWVNIVGEIVAFNADGTGVKSLLTPRDLREDLPMLGAKVLTLQRAPHIVDFAADDPECVIVQAEGIVRPNGMRLVDRFKLNVITGKLTPLHDQMLHSYLAYLFDRNGKARIAVPDTIHDEFPHKLVYNTGAAFRRWKPFDAFAAGTGRAAFSISPLNYFGERSVPLGFEYDNKVLYYASNVGRDTFGIYAMDMATGKSLPMAAESASFDMYRPGPGTFPDTAVSSLFEREEPAFTAQEETDATSSLAGNAATASWESAMGGEAPEESVIGNRMSPGAIFARAEVQGRSRSVIGGTDTSILITDRFAKKVVGINVVGITPTTKWFTPELQAVQNGLEKMSPGATVRIQAWDSTRQRFLVLVSSLIDPGSFYIYDRAQNRVSQFAVRSPTHDRKQLHQTTHYTFKSPAGHTISGTFTFPHAARSVPVPTVVFCASEPWARIHMSYSPEVLALAQMGFAVLQVDTRGAWGFGIKHREAVRQGYEAAQIADISEAVDHIAKAFAIDAKRVALFGEGYGGYLALRGIQLQPNKFRLALVLDGIFDLDNWLKELRWTYGDASPEMMRAFLGGTDRIKSASLFDSNHPITRPALLLSYRGPGGSPEPSTYIDARRIARAIDNEEVRAEVFDLTDDYMMGLPRARSEAFRKIEDFLNTWIYDYKVKLGDLKIIRE